MVVWTSYVTSCMSFDVIDELHGALSALGFVNWTRSTKSAIWVLHEHGDIWHWVGATVARRGDRWVIAPNAGLYNPWVSRTETRLSANDDRLAGRAPTLCHPIARFDPERPASYAAPAALVGECCRKIADVWRFIARPAFAAEASLDQMYDCLVAGRLCEAVPLESRLVRRMALACLLRRAADVERVSEEIRAMVGDGDKDGSYGGYYLAVVERAAQLVGVANPQDVVEKLVQRDLRALRSLG